MKTNMNNDRPKWDNIEARKDACVKVLTHILSDNHVKRDGLTSDEYMRQVFLEVGNIEVPGNVKIVLLPEGDFEEAKQHHRGSLILEIPPEGTTDREKLLAHVLCSYAQWFEGKPYTDWIGPKNPSKLST